MLVYTIQVVILVMGHLCYSCCYFLSNVILVAYPKALMFHNTLACLVGIPSAPAKAGRRLRPTCVLKCTLEFLKCFFLNFFKPLLDPWLKDYSLILEFGCSSNFCPPPGVDGWVVGRVVMRTPLRIRFLIFSSELWEAFQKNSNIFYIWLNPLHIFWKLTQKY